MKKITKKISLTLVAAGLFTYSLPSTSLADELPTSQTTSEEEIQSVKQFKEEVKDINSADELSNNKKQQEINNLKEDVPSGIQQDYNEEMTEEMLNEINKLNSEVTFDTEEDSSYENSKVLSDGSVLHVEYVNEEIPTDEDGNTFEVAKNDSESPLFLTGFASPLTDFFSNKLNQYSAAKKYGSYRFISRYYVKKTALPDPKLVLNTFYTVGKSGLTATSTSTAGTSASYPWSLSSSSDVTDSSANKIGYDINGQGDYVINDKVNLTHQEVALRSTIKLVAWNKTKKTASVSTATWIYS